MKRKLWLLLAPLLTSSPFLLGQESVTPSPAYRPQDPEPVWAKTFEEAVERARSMPNGRIFVELLEEPCPQCERMASLVYPSASFRAFVRDKVPVSLLRSSPDGTRLSERFGVQLSPAWLILTPDLLLAGKQEGASNQSTWFDRFIASEHDWALFRQKLAIEKATPGDPAATLAVGEEAYRRFGNEMAEERFRRVAGDPKVPNDLRERALSYLASIALEARRLDDAEKALKEILATTKDPVLREKAELRLADVDLGRGDRGKAAERLATFLEKHPESPLRPQAEDLLKALGSATR
jgi:tetratricopeptide (TPR) repeat protein